ncbi:MAG: alanine--tRNA ligase [Gemmatimonadota bacterium]
MKAHEIRSRFVEYFEAKGHLHLPSSSLVPEDDPTLLFTNAGMVQFKRSFTGETGPPAPRVVTSQKCLRVSGKHNDLEEVGRTARHHTFFEMLGNFSFGDYFKREAIAYAWEFATGELGLDTGRLWATVHHSDTEAARLWLETTELPPSRVLKLGDKDNFWQMGDVGPCGPCSELHYDMRPAGAPARLTEDEFVEIGETDAFMEIWNLVFMQFERSESGDDPLPAPSIDTGAGLERIAAILQGTKTNYHTDLFLPIISAAEEIIGRPYSQDPSDWEDGLAFRVMADHARAAAFMISDGVFPSNEGRGYVLRRILRRAGRYAWLLGRREATLDVLVGVVADIMSDTYPELAARRNHLLSTTRAEEERFLATIDAGMHRFDDIAPAGSSGVIAGAEAFRLYDTFGFPLDLTQLMAAERGYEVDEAGFEIALSEQRERSREARGSGGSGRKATAGAAAQVVIDSGAAQEFTGYDQLTVDTSVIGFSKTDDGRAAFALADNPFYAEAGGQVSDRGEIRADGWVVEVDTVVKDADGVTLVEGPITAGDLEARPERVMAAVPEDVRRDTERNHTATHLLHAALRAELGTHVQQAGSLVAPDRLRFDFQHRGPLSPVEREAVERWVNRAVWGNEPVETTHTDYREALASGAMALFGEKYGDVVRVVSVPGVSTELCGGCHVRTTGQIAQFRITSETGVAAGVRRIEAVTGERAYERAVSSERRLAELADALRTTPDQLGVRLGSLISERDRLQEQLAERHGEDSAGLARRVVSGGDDLPGPGGTMVSGEVELSSGADLREFGDRLRGELTSGAAIVHVTVPSEGQAAFLAVATDDWISRGLKAGDLVRIASKATGSGGGGKPHLAQGGVGDPERVAEALQGAREHAFEVATEAGAK